MIKSFSIQKSSNKPPNVFVDPALKSPTKQIFGHCSSSHNCLNLPRYVKNSSVLVKQTTRNIFSVKIKSKSNPFLENKTSLLILLEAAGVRIQKVQNPVHAHLWSPLENYLATATLWVHQDQCC